MPRSRRLWVPILTGVLAILFTIGVLVGWNIIFTSYYVLATRPRAASIPDLGAGYWVLLSIGSLFLVLVVVALVLFLIGNIRQALLVDSQKAFIDRVTHELKSPLASLSLSLETMQSRTLTPEVQTKFLEMMKKDIGRLRTFIQNVLDAGRLDHGNRRMNIEPVELPKLVEDAAARVCQLYGLAPDEVALELESLPQQPIMSDRLALETIFFNLLDNAAKYSLRPARIIVRSSLSNASLLFSVTDTGIGIPEGELKRIFRRFYRVERKGSTARGSGLGLCVVAGLSRRLKGNIRAVSDGEGKGSTFTLELPLRLAAAGESTSSTMSKP